MLLKQTELHIVLSSEANTARERFRERQVKSGGHWGSAVQLARKVFVVVDATGYPGWRTARPHEKKNPALPQETAVVVFCEFTAQGARPEAKNDSPPATCQP